MDSGAAERTTLTENSRQDRPADAVSLVDGGTLDALLERAHEEGVVRGVVDRIPQHPEQRCRSGSVAGAGHRAGQHVSFDAALSLRGVVVGFAVCQLAAYGRSTRQQPQHNDAQDPSEPT